MTDQTFAGFEPIDGNFTQVPNQVFELMPTLSGSELKCLMYVVRHTLGFQDKVKTITIDEFEHGRKKKNGQRMDNGVGMGRETIINALKTLAERAIITREIDIRDKARQKITYGLHQSDNPTSEDQSEKPTAVVGKTDRKSRKSRPRSVKETIADTPLEDALSKRIAAIIDAWRKLSKSLKGNPFKNTTFRSYAEAMDAEGITAADITRFMVEQTKPGAYWYGKAIPFGTVADQIGAWIATHPSPRVNDTTPAPEPEPVITEADRAESLAILRAARGKVSA
jgi:hypothetical protein